MRNTYAPLLSSAEISQIHADRDEAVMASIAHRTPATVVHLVKHSDGSEKLLPGGDDLFASWGGCGCAAGLAKCNCGLDSWLKPSTNSQPSELSWKLSDLAVALVLVLTIALVIFGGVR